MGTWAIITNAIAALGQFFGLVRKAREAVAPLPNQEPTVADAAAQRAGTEAGAAATSAGRRAGRADYE